VNFQSLVATCIYTTLYSQLRLPLNIAYYVAR